MTEDTFVLVSIAHYVNKIFGVDFKSKFSNQVLFYEWANRSVIVDADVNVPNDASILKAEYSYFVVKPDSGEQFDLFVIKTEALSN